MGAVDIPELSTSYEHQYLRASQVIDVIMLMIWSPSGTGNVAYNSTVLCQIGGPRVTGNALTSAQPANDLRSQWDEKQWQRNA